MGVVSWCLGVSPVAGSENETVFWSVASVLVAPRQLRLGSLLVLDVVQHALHIFHSILLSKPVLHLGQLIQRPFLERDSRGGLALRMVLE
jgi:hypothetical protein